MSNPPSPPCQGGTEKQAGTSPLPEKGGRGVGYLPYKIALTPLARENRKKPTVAEQKIWQELLRNRQFLGYKFLRQKPIDGYIADFYCSELRLIIEIDGDSHASSIEYDTERTRIMNAYGLMVVRYSNQEIMHNLEGVHDDLRRKVEHV